MEAPCEMQVYLNPIWRGGEYAPSPPPNEKSKYVLGPHYNNIILYDIFVS